MLVRHRNYTKRPFKTRLSRIGRVQTGIKNVYDFEPVFDPRSSKAVNARLVAQQDMRTVTRLLLDNPSPGRPLKFAIDALAPAEGTTHWGRPVAPGRRFRSMPMLIDKNPGGGNPLC